jgi:hypothetical protein
VRDPSGRSLHDRDAGLASETRQLGDAEREASLEARAWPYLVALAALFVIAVIVLMVTR